MIIQTSTKEKGSFEKPHIPEDMYEATFIGVKEIKDGKYGKRILCVFNIDSKKVELGMVCYLRPATKDNKLGEVVIALGIPINDAAVDLTAHVGKKVRVLVEDYEYEEDKDGVKTKKKASSISKVKPLVEKTA